MARAEGRGSARSTSSTVKNARCTALAAIAKDRLATSDMPSVTTVTFERRIFARRIDEI